MRILSKTDSRNCSMCDHSWEDHNNGKSPCFNEADNCNCEWCTIKMTFNKNK